MGQTEKLVERTDGKSGTVSFSEWSGKIATLFHSLFLSLYLPTEDEVMKESRWEMSTSALFSGKNWVSSSIPIKTKIERRENESERERERVRDFGKSSNAFRCYRCVAVSIRGSFVLFGLHKKYSLPLLLKRGRESGEEGEIGRQEVKESISGLMPKLESFLPFQEKKWQDIGKGEREEGPKFTSVSFFF